MQPCRCTINEAFQAVKTLFILYTILTLKCCKNASMKFRCANVLVVLRMYAVAYLRRDIDDQQPIAVAPNSKFQSSFKKCNTDFNAGRLNQFEHFESFISKYQQQKRCKCSFSREILVSAILLHFCCLTDLR